MDEMNIITVFVNNYNCASNKTIFEIYKCSYGKKGSDQYCSL